MKRVLLVLLLVLGMTAAVTPPAAADVHCADGYYCLYDSPEFKNSVIRMSVPGVGVCKNIPSWFNNLASSDWNAHSLYGMVLYDGLNCTGANVASYPHNGHSYLSVFGMSNKASSFRPFRA